MAIDLRTIPKCGEAIYAARYKQELEATARGQIVAIDVTTEKAYVRSAPGEALSAAELDHPEGYFYLIKIGSPHVYRYGGGSVRASVVGQIDRQPICLSGFSTRAHDSDVPGLTPG